MSHFNDYYGAKEACRQTGDCNEFEVLAQERITQERNYRDQNIVLIGLSTLVVVLFFSLFILTGYSKKIKSFMSRIVQIATLLAPIVVLSTAGLFIGFAVSFSACYKQSCSVGESTAIFTLPVIGLLIGIFSSIPLWRRRKAIYAKLLTAERGWQVWGVVLVILTLLFGSFLVVQRIADFNSYSEYLLQP